MKKNNTLKAFRLIEYNDNDVGKVPVVNTLEKEEILSQEEAIDQANMRVKKMEQYVDRANNKIVHTF